MSAENPSMYSCTLPQTVEYEGKTYKELSFNWSKLTGKDYAAVEKIIKARGERVMMPEMDGAFLSLLAVRASENGLSEEAIKALPLYYYNKILGAARSFLLISGSGQAAPDGSESNA